MSFASRVYKNRRSVVSVGLVTLFGAGILGFALLYDGESTAEVDLNDSGVWVTRTSAGELGRFNYEAKALDGVLLASSASFDVEQDAQRVLLNSASTSSASPVNPAQLALDATMTLPTGAQVASGRATTAVYDPETGRVWVLPFDSAAFDEKRLKPVVTTGKGGRLTVGNNGTAFVAVPADSKLYTIPTSKQGVAQDVEESSLPVAPDAEVQVSAVGDEPVVLDVSTGNLVLPGGETVKVEDGAQGMLQQPSGDGDNVVLATPGSLVSQPLGGGDAKTQMVDGGAAGSVSAPVQLNGCIYGAWAGSGQVVRLCEDEADNLNQVLEGFNSSANLVYRVNRDLIVLNDVINGQMWMAPDKFELVDDWDYMQPKSGKGDKTDSEQTTPLLVDNFVADRNKPNRKPEPKDDSFGVRPGRTTVLNVLANDSDKDGDVLTASVKTPPEGDVTIDRVVDGLALQADVPDDASGDYTFEYTVADGRTGEADASVTVKVVPLDENHAPRQPDGIPVLRVGQGELASIKVLPYFKDPDGDDLYLSDAKTADPLDEVRFRPDGMVEFRDGGATTGFKIVDLQVTDSNGMPVDGKLRVDVVAENVPPVAVQDHVTVLAGEPVTVDPLKNDHDANGDKLSLNTVTEPPGAAITKNTAAGTFRFEADRSGSYDVAYQITDGPEATLGLVRVDVIDPPDEAGAPVAVSDQVLLPTGGTALVDVLANDTDPAGGVLVVQGVSVPTDAPISVSVLNHQILKVSEIKRLGEPVIVTYRVANASGTVTGQVRVVPIPAPAQMRPPEAGHDEAVVHVGDVVTVPVLKNDSHPDGVAMHITDDLQESPPTSAGEAFVSEDTVRFRAGNEAGTYDAVYEVEDANGQKDSARITFTVKDDSANTAPQLPDVEARVLSNGIVRIPLPLDGSDPDGDYVTLSSISGAPGKGTARIVDGFVDYQAAEDATGLDTFTYQVTDTRGAVGEGLVRVGIVAIPATNQDPQALDDETTVRPDRTVAVSALDNDSDPDGDQIGLVAKGFEGTEDLEPKAVDDDVVVTAPTEEGPYSFYYGIQDSYQAPASGAITVNVDRNAPLLRPVAHDDVITADDVQGSTSVTVGVLDNDVDPDGVGADLEVAVDPGLEGVEVTESNAIRVQLTENAQVITYTVTDMDGKEAKAFVRVPGDQSRPHVKPGLDPLKAFSGEPLTIDLADYIVVREGREPRITEDRTVKALEGKVEITDKDTVVYTSAADYAGAASVSFEVTDGKGPDDAEGLTAVLTLPIDVTPSKNQPPKITGTPVLKVANAEKAVVDLSRYVKDPDKDPLTFEFEDKEGVTTLVSGAVVTGEVASSVPKGTILQLPMTVSDGLHDVQAALTVEVTASTRPPVKTTDDVLEAHQGKPTTVAVLENDSNPFPDKPMKVVAAASEAGGGEVTFTDSDVVVTPAPDFTGVMTVRYTVQDATGDPDRQVDGFARLTVLGKPDAPRAPRIEEVRSETVVLSWDQPNNNGAEITGYTLRTDTGQEHKCSTTTCTFDGLQNNVKYTFTVTATNEVDESAPSPASRQVRPDEKPDKPEPPSLKFGDQKLTVSWQNKSYTDRSPIDCVTLEISPPPTDGVTQKVCQTRSPVTWTGLENGTAYTVRVQAKNDAEQPSEWSEYSTPEVPAAKPAQPAAPTAIRSNADVGGQITVSWTAPANNGDAIKTYYLTEYRDGNKTRTLRISGRTEEVIEELSTESTYKFTVEAENKAGRSPVSAYSNELVPYGIPKIPNTPTAAIGSTTSGQANVSWDHIGDFRGAGGYYQVRANGGTPQKGTATPSYTHKGLSNQTPSTFQVQACNVNICSDWSGSSNAVQPYGLPVPPTMVATGGIGNVKFTWDGDGYNGRDTTVRVSGAVRTTTVKTGSATANGNEGQVLEACVTVTDDLGKTAQDCDSAAVLTPRAWVTPAATGPTCRNEECRYWVVNWQGFDATSEVACWAGDTSQVPGGPREWHDIHEINGEHPTSWGASVKYPMNGASGSRQLSCFMGESYNGVEVRVMVDGVPYQISRWNVG